MNWGDWSMNPTYKGQLACQKMYNRESSDSLHAACTHIGKPSFTSMFRSKSDSESETQNAPVTKKRSLYQKIRNRNAVVVWDVNADYANLTRTYEASNAHKLFEKRDLRYGILFADPLDPKSFCQYFRELATL